MPDENEFIAYKIYPNAITRLEPSPIARDWMDDCDSRFAYRCLPMVLANGASQSVWVDIAYDRRHTCVLVRWSRQESAEQAGFASAGE